MVAAASARTAADTTAILPNFSIMTRSCYFSGGEPALGLEFANRDVKQGASWDFRAAISRYRPIWLSRGPSDGHRRLSFWTFYFDNIAGSRLGGCRDLGLGQIERWPTGSKASRESAAARRRAATISDGLICSSQQTASIARRFLNAVLFKTELLQVSRKRCD